jgi:hypothetical protein
MNYNELYEQYKQQYQQLKTQHGGSSKHTKYKNFTGAGIILLEDYDNQKGRREPAVILFKNNHMRAYADLGGHIDKKDLSTKNPLMSAALREAHEESCGLLTLKSIPDRYIDLKSYRCYFIKIASNTIKTEDFNKNLKNIQNSKLPPSYKETNDMARFYISDLLRTNIMNQKGDLPTIDAKESITIITGRAKALIREAIRSGIIYMACPIKLQKKQIKIYNTKLITLMN